MKMIIAEDEYITAELFKTQIERLGHEVLAITHSGEETVVKVKELEPEVVFMDISMEYRTDGLDACKKIKAYNKNIKIFFLTAYQKDMFKDELNDILFDGFIDKFEFKARVTALFPQH
jgi:CheY-like chemotaxis protein